VSPLPRFFSAILFMRMRYFRYLSSMENFAGWGDSASPPQRGHMSFSVYWLQLLHRLRSHTIRGYSLVKAMLPSIFSQASSANLTTMSNAYSAFL